MDNNEKMWGGEFGLMYTLRQKINIDERYKIWEKLLSKLNGIGNVLEIGSNEGNNLFCVQNILNFNHSNTRNMLNVCGVEINESSANLTRNLTIIGSAYNVPLLSGKFDLVFTSGVLIHLEDTLKAMKEIYRLSNRYILSIEYFDDKERKIEYRDGVYCSAKPFDRLWLDNFDLDLVELGDMKDFGLDDGTDFSRNCKYAIFKKP